MSAHSPVHLKDLDSAVRTAEKAAMMATMYQEACDKQWQIVVDLLKQYPHSHQKKIIQEQVDRHFNKRSKMMTTLL